MRYIFRSNSSYNEHYKASYLKHFIHGHYIVCLDLFCEIVNRMRQIISLV